MGTTTFEGLYPTQLDRIPGDAPATCTVCGAPPEGESFYVYYCEERKRWVHRECVHKFFNTEEGKAFLSNRPPITVAGEDE